MTAIPHAGDGPIEPMVEGDLDTKEGRNARERDRPGQTDSKGQRGIMSETQFRPKDSGEWLIRNGSGTYGPRARGRSVSNRRTRPIRPEYFDRIVRAGQCLGCGPGRLSFSRNPRGGSYYSCSSGGHACYYIGMNPRSGVGYELIAATPKETGP